MPVNPAFFVRGDDGVDYGPVDLAELQEWVVENRVGLGTRVRADAPGEDWNLWQHYPELVALLAEVRATGGPVPVVAPIGRRMLAFVGDLFLSLILVAPLIVLLYCLLPLEFLSQMTFYSQAVIHDLPVPGPAPVLPFWFQVATDAILLIVPVIYYGGFYAFMGRTPAKSLVRLQVVDASGRKPAPGKSLVRAFVFAVCVFFCFGIPLLYAFLNPQRRALHDIAAGTYVVEL